jgi:hypothetical protein
MPGHVEWKYYSHDGPELRERLLAAGLEPEDEETVVVAEAASIPPPPADVELRLVTGRVRGSRGGVFGARFDLPEKAVPSSPWSTGSRSRAGAWTSEDGVEFAGLFGGVTLPEFRGEGCIARPSAKRAELARERGYRWLYSDALPTSRPILERLGFVAITTTTPFVIPAAVR